MTSRGSEDRWTTRRPVVLCLVVSSMLVIVLLIALVFALVFLRVFGGIA